MSNPTSGTWLVEKSFCPETKQPCFDIESKESNHFIGRAYLKDDALLMAAAPELLNSLKALLPFAEKRINDLNEKMTGNLYPYLNVCMIEDAKKAITKATGEQSCGIPD